MHTVNNCKMITVNNNKSDDVDDDDNWTKIKTCYVLGLEDHLLGLGLVPVFILESLQLPNRS